MRLSHLLADLPKKFSPLAKTNIDSFSSPDGINFVFSCGDYKEELASLKEDLKTNNEIITDLEKKQVDLEKEIDKLNKEVEKKDETLDSYVISPTDTIADLVERNEWQENRITEQQTTLRNYLQRFQDFEREVKELKARKNKASVKRCVKTGRLIATLQDVEYEMTPVSKVNSLS